MLSESKNEEYIEEQKKMDKAKDEFIAMVTHELKTPLVPILGYADILLSEHFGKVNPQQKERIRLIKLNSESLLRLIQDLLDAQSIELGRLKLEKQTIHLEKIINSVIEKVRSVFEKKGITLSVELDEIHPCICDRVRIEQVLNNILLNCADFVPNENGKITVKLYEINKEAKIVIKDNGPGMEKENLSKIFVKFYQADTSGNRKRLGKGLGLSICKGIIESHGGKIWAESEGLGKGSEFHILLPCYISENLVCHA